MAMAINYRKLKAQIKPFKPEAKHTGYIFIATEEQQRNFICSVSQPGSKRDLMESLKYLISIDEDFRNEFTI